MLLSSNSICFLSNSSTNLLLLLNSTLPKRYLFFAKVIVQRFSARVIATYKRRLSSSNLRKESHIIGLGKMFSSNPTMKILGYSNPFEACIVINETLLSVSSLESESDNKATCCKKSGNPIESPSPSSLRASTNS